MNAHTKMHGRVHALMMERANRTRSRVGCLVMGVLYPLVVRVSRGQERFIYFPAPRRLAGLPGPLRVRVVAGVDPVRSREETVGHGAHLRSRDRHADPLTVKPEQVHARTAGRGSPDAESVGTDRDEERSRARIAERDPRVVAAVRHGRVIDVLVTGGGTDEVRGAAGGEDEVRGVEEVGESGAHAGSIPNFAAAVKPLHQYSHRNISTKLSGAEA